MPGLLARDLRHRVAEDLAVLQADVRDHADAPWSRRRWSSPAGRRAPPRSPGPARSCSRNSRKPSAVSTSKVTSCAVRHTLACTRSTAAATSSTPSAELLRATRAAPSIWMRSVKRCRWGLVNRPVRQPSRPQHRLDHRRDAAFALAAGDVHRRRGRGAGCPAPPAAPAPAPRPRGRQNRPLRSKSASE